jgi:FlaA1/EpsC-like NDP-sugar epimerase
MMPMLADSPGAPAGPVAQRKCQARADELGFATETPSPAPARRSGTWIRTHATVTPDESVVAWLLGRTPEIVYSEAAQTLIDGQRILVTGAGGSIGSEIVRQLVALGPAAVYLLDHDESALHALELELHGHGLLTDSRTVLADIRDAPTIQRVIGEITPGLVFHAAAHKHLPLLERFPAEGIKANVLGTRNVVSAAVAAGAHCIVNISTDKAAQPTSVLGASKRLAEHVAASYACAHTRVASVRFGNVLGSRGSFLPTLMWQVANGVPITITDPAVTRFFMTIPEASNLVVEAASMASAGETYVLDMGEPVRIVDLMSRYLDMVGGSSEVIFTGLREGEKLHEELVDGHELSAPTQHSKISRISKRTRCGGAVDADINLLCESAHTAAPEILRSALWDLCADADRPRPVGRVA